MALVRVQRQVPPSPTIVVVPTAGPGDALGEELVTGLREEVRGRVRAGGTPGDVPSHRPPPPPAHSTTGASTVSAAPDVPYVIGSLIVVVVLAAVCVALNYYQWDTATNPRPTIALASGLNVFALFYVLAQAEERLLEPISWRLLAKEDHVKKRDQKLAGAENDPTPANLTAAANAQAELDKRRANRVVVFWAIATGVALFSSGYFGLYFLTTIGLKGVPHAFDIVVTSLVIGGGTKPLHDLITRIQQSKDKSADTGVG